MNRPASQASRSNCLARLTPPSPSPTAPPSINSLSAAADVRHIRPTRRPGSFPAPDPIGGGIKGFDARGPNDDWVRVIGVVKDVHSRGLERAPMAQIYEAQEQAGDQTPNLVVRMDMSAGALRDALRSIDRGAVLRNVRTLEDRLREQECAPPFSDRALKSVRCAGAGTRGGRYFRD